MSGKCLLSFGHGYSARALGRKLGAEGWRILGTTRSAETARAIRAEGAEPLPWPPDKGALDEASHVLVSIAPGEEGDPVLAHFADALADRAEKIAWVGYLSTTGVYGDRQGAWVDEGSERDAGTKRGQTRVRAEDAWLALHRDHGLPVHIFRLAGIYGPGRGPFAKVRAGTARRIVKPGQIFSRIHVDDIAAVLAASIARPAPGTAYNVCDNHPAPPEDVIAEAAHLLGLPLPPEVPFEEADLSPMARSFYSESKRVSNARIKDALGVTLTYPDYQTGLRALLKHEAEADGGEGQGRASGGKAANP
ncbi:MAG: SDR family oxidoreductase [Pseudomonadota bacterium]